MQKNKDLGFDSENIIRLQLEGSIHSKIEAVRQELTQNPNVLSLTSVNCSFLGRSNSVGVNQWEGKTGGESIGMALHAVDHDFVMTFKMKMTQGRFFSLDFSSSRTGRFVFGHADDRISGR